MGLTFFELEFNKNAELVDDTQLRAVKDSLSAERYTDMLVFAHGWNNDMDEARGLYTHLLDLVEAQLQGAGGDKKLLVIGLLWPSKKFADKELIAGGAADTSMPYSAEEERQLDELMGELEARQDADLLADKFTRLIRSVASEESRLMDEDAYKHLSREKIKEILTDEHFLDDKPCEEGREGVIAVHPVEAEPAAGGGTSVFSVLKAGVRTLLNLTTYYKMKARAGWIGRKGLNTILHELKQQVPEIKIHLAGHSFGARLVTSALLGPDSGSLVRVNSLCLIQAAFSQHAFAAKYDGVNDGMFREVLLKQLVEGPVLVTHTRNDKAVGLAYAIASRLARQAGESLGGASDLYGGLGANGAQQTPEKMDGLLAGPDETYQFVKGKVFNLNSDLYIGGHSDILKPEVARLIVAALGI